jgi:hypothetical protein
MVEITVDILAGLAAFVSALFLFAGSAYSMVIKGRIPVGKFSVIFPYLTMGSFMLGFMMVTYAIIFLAHLVEIITYVTTVMFFFGTITMMIGAYRVTLSFTGQMVGPVQRRVGKVIEKGKGVVGKRKAPIKKKGKAGKKAAGKKKREEKDLSEE